MIAPYLLVTALFFSGCQSTQPLPPQPASANVQRLLILPFTNMAAIYGGDANVRSPFGGGVFSTGPVTDDAVSFLTNALEGKIRTRTQIQLVSAGPAHALMETLLVEPERMRRETLVSTAARLNADAVMAGFIYRFSQRIGGDYGVKKAASAAFDLYLLRTADGQLIWQGQFDQTQQPLSQNLLQLKTFLNRGGQWITVEQMAGEGLATMLQRAPLGMAATAD
jgi:hypothetical protein